MAEFRLSFLSSLSLPFYIFRHSIHELRIFTSILSQIVLFYYYTLSVHFEQFIHFFDFYTNDIHLWNFSFVLSMYLYVHINIYIYTSMFIYKYIIHIGMLEDLYIQISRFFSTFSFTTYLTLWSFRFIFFFFFS